MTTLWIILAVFAGLSLLALKPPNAATGGLVLGAIGGALHGSLVDTNGLNKILIFKWIIVFVLIGYAFEVLRRVVRMKQGNPIDD